MSHPANPPVRPYTQLPGSGQFSFYLGLSPTIHSIDQIKVVDRFRGTFPLPSLSAHPRIFLRPCSLNLPPPTPYSLHFTDPFFSYARFRNPTRRRDGRPRLVRPRFGKRRLCDISAVSRLSVLVLALVQVQFPAFSVREGAVISGGRGVSGGVASLEHGYSVHVVRCACGFLSGPFPHDLAPH